MGENQSGQFIRIQGSVEANSGRYSFKAILNVVWFLDNLKSGRSFQSLGREKKGRRFTWSVLAKGIYNRWASLRL